MSVDEQELTNEESQDSAADRELSESDLEQAAGGIRTEMLNNKYPENMKHEIREHTLVADSEGEFKAE